MHLTVLACDLDGTLAQDGRVSPETWQALRQAKLAGLTMILVTGRVLDSFLTSGPYDELFAAIVAEDGAVVRFPNRDETAMPFGGLPPEVMARIMALDVPLEQGQAILATHVPHDEAILAELRKTGGGATVEYNRGAVMILPPGATKATGLRYALRELGYSPRNVVGCGDAENDRSLFQAVELAAAVPNASSDIRALADIVLPRSNGAGVRSLIGDLVSGKRLDRSPRPSHALYLGQELDDTPFYLDSYAFVDRNAGIFGASGTGKSWLAGLLIEELLKQGYHACIIDPEGDYRGIQALPHTLLLGGTERPLPAVVDLVTLVEHSNISLILDLSAYSPEECKHYVADVLRTLWGLRTRRGRPHYFLLDEIQSLCPRGGDGLTDLVLQGMERGGVTVVSYRPSLVSRKVLEAIDYYVLNSLYLPEEIDEVTAQIDNFGGDTSVLSDLATLSQDQAYVYLRQRRGPFHLQMRTSARQVPHVRHLHKYLRGSLAPAKRFYFHSPSGRDHYPAAGNLWDLRQALADLPLATLTYHLDRHDLENWLKQVLRDETLARRLRKIRHRNLGGEELRRALLETVINRYEELNRLT